jgi:nitrogen regulatory protein PII
MSQISSELASLLRQVWPDFSEPQPIIRRSKIIVLQLFQFQEPGKGVDTQMSYQAIVTVVDKGMIDRVFESARCEESCCGTVIAGRGSGMHENKKLFNLALEPEKEILLVLAQEGHSEKIINQIEEAVNITAPGNGILFGLNIKRVHGIQS